METPVSQPIEQHPLGFFLPENTKLLMLGSFCVIERTEKIFDDEEWTELYRNFRNMRKIRDISLNPHIALSIIVKPFNKRPPIYPETDFASENGATTCR